MQAVAGFAVGDPTSAGRPASRPATLPTDLAVRLVRQSLGLLLCAGGHVVTCGKKLQTVRWVAEACSSALLHEKQGAGEAAAAPSGQVVEHLHAQVSVRAQVRLVFMIMIKPCAQQHVLSFRYTGPAGAAGAATDRLDV